MVLAPLMTTTEVASVLNCDSETVRELIRCEALKAVNIATGERPTWRITQEALNEFINQGGKK